MKIDQLTIANVIGVRRADIRPSVPVTMICGPNGAGKSSLRDAIALALTADLCRVALKKEAGALITDGQSDGTVELIVDGEVFAVTITEAGRVIDSQAGCDKPPELAYILDGSRFARASADERRELLFDITGSFATPDDVKQRLIARGVDEARATSIAPYLRAGFPEAQKESQAKAREAKASWRTVTGETYGDKKAEGWEPPAVEASGDPAAKAENAEAKARELDEQISALQQELGAARATQQAAQQHAVKVQRLYDQVAMIDRIKGRLATAEGNVEDCRAQLAAAGGEDPKAPGSYLLRGFASVTAEFVTEAEDSAEVIQLSPQTEALLARARAHLAEYRKLHGDPSAEPGDPARAEEIRRGLQVAESGAANARRDLAAAEAAAAELAEIEKAQQDSEAPDTGAIQARIAALTEQRNQWQADARKYRELHAAAGRRARQIENAARHHTDVQQWSEIADALSPTGIPAEILADALRPFSDRLSMTSKLAGWNLPVIDGDMSITVGGRPYGLLSESEKWRADCLLAEAISHVSDRRLLVLDRMDVLDAQGRNDLIFWLADMADADAFDTAVVLGTMRRDQLEKALPGLPDNFGVFWMEDGVLGAMSATAKAAEVAA